METTQFKDQNKTRRMGAGEYVAGRKADLSSAGSKQQQQQQQQRQPPPESYYSKTNPHLDGDLESVPSSESEPLTMSPLEQELQSQRHLDTKPILQHAESSFKENPSLRKVGEDEDDDHEEHQLSDDVYSMLFISRFPSQAFFFSIVTFLLKQLLFTFVVLDLFSGGTESNPFSVPPGITPIVRAAQFFMLPIAVAMQEDLIGSFALVNVKYTPSIMDDKPGATLGKWMFGSLCRTIDGFYSLTINFGLLIQANEILGLFLNFAALAFLQTVDNVAFHLALDGYFGDRTQNCAKDCTSIRMPMKKNGKLQMFDTIMFVGCYFAILIPWCVLTMQQIRGDFQCQSMTVEFGDEHWEEVLAKSYSGTYHQVGSLRKSKRSVYIEDTSISEKDIRGLFGYCGRDEVWTFIFTEKEPGDVTQDELCNFELRSPNAVDFFDVTGTTASEWTMKWEGKEVPATSFGMSCLD